MRFGKIGARRMTHNGPVLPLGARWVEYLESTGTQWIDTDIIADLSNTDIEISSNDENFTTGVGCIFGAFSNGINWYFLQTFVSGVKSLLYRFGSVDTYVPTPSGFVVSKYVNKNVYCNGNLIGTTTRTTVQTNSFPLFARFNVDRIDYFAKTKIAYCKIWNNGILVRDFRPIAIGNKGYMLDLLTGEYEQYGNKGEGEFVIGPTIAYPERERERESKQLFGLIFHFDNYSTNNIFESDFALSYLKEAA